MRLLGIDWGEKKFGLAIAEGALAEPYAVVATRDQVLKIIAKEKIEKIIVGLSESASAQKAREFGQALSRGVTVPVEFSDETLSSHDARRLAIESGIGRKKRKGLEDSYAAAIMLQSYLERVR